MGSAVLVATTIACAGEGATTPGSTEDRPSLSGGTCQFTPTSVDLAVDSIAIFFPDGDCPLLKRKATLTWANPQTPVRTGLGVDVTCGKQVDYRTGLWKVTRCATGTATLTIYSDSAGSSVLQTIPIEDAVP
ncbi:MAG TPA: hypothetical protein VG712_04620 [Gemmatimonadales bacterium]|nr:hypothetical protein [Gemmatimonadales bacterium]